jgi:hypothetical protein
MSAVGEFPGLQAAKRRTIRGPVNPLDKSSVVSIFPKEIDEVKPTIQPGRFVVPAGSYVNPSILVVGPSSWWREIDEEQPLLEIPVSSIQIADSVVKDYCNGILACDMQSAVPGLFYLPGEQTVDTVKKSFKNELDKAKERQNNWYSSLIKLADALWARSNGNPLAISDDMRLAARELNLQNKDWMKDFKMVDMVRCYACGALKNPEYPVCGQCRAIDHNNPRAKDIRFAI